MNNTIRSLFFMGLLSSLVVMRGNQPVTRASAIENAITKHDIATLALLLCQKNMSLTFQEKEHYIKKAIQEVLVLKAQKSPILRYMFSLVLSLGRVGLSSLAFLGAYDEMCNENPNINLALLNTAFGITLTCAFLKELPKVFACKKEKREFHNALAIEAFLRCMPSLAENKTNEK